MKKGIILVVVVLMFGYAVYDLIQDSKKDSASSDNHIVSQDESEVGSEDQTVSQLQLEESNDQKISQDESEEESNDLSTSQPEVEEEMNEPIVETPDVPEGLDVGNLAPDFELTTLDGETVKLSDYRGNRVMINFWATWCPPCRAEMPDMQKLYENKDVEILAVNLTHTETNADDVDDFRGEYNLTFPILMDKTMEVSTDYQIRPIPTSFMVDSRGVIQYKAFGALNYDLMATELEKME